jgi:hypothetical protein
VNKNKNRIHTITKQTKYQQEKMNIKKKKKEKHQVQEK